MKFHFPLPLALLILLIAAGIFAATLPSKQIPMQTSGEYTTVHIGSVAVRAELATTTISRQQGLSGHIPLGEKEGMLFVFEEDTTEGFWMKDMLFPIDIIWIDAEGRVVTIAASVTPDSYPEVFYPTAPARYVLEVQAGFAKTYGIAEGAKVVVE